MQVDVALLVDETTQVAQVAEFLRVIGRKLLRDVVLFEVYRGESVAAGKKSLNFTVTLGADDLTLTDEDDVFFHQVLLMELGAASQIAGIHSSNGLRLTVGSF